MIAALEEIAPGNAEILLSKLVISNVVALTEDEVDLTLVDALAYYNNDHNTKNNRVCFISSYHNTEICIINKYMQIDRDHSHNHTFQFEIVVFN